MTALVQQQTRSTRPPAARAALPEFIIIGAAKAATSWVSHQLRQHPGAFLPAPEPHYFSTEFERGLDWYSDFFRSAVAGQKIGEKSADYLAHPAAPRRIAELVPDARLIVQLRNPIERAYSDYCMLYRRGTVGNDPRPYLDRMRTSQPRFLDDGLYRLHLDRFLDHFAREQIKIVLHDDIRAAPAAVIGDVCRHVGLEPQLAPATAGQRVNDSQAALLPLGMRRMLGPFKPMVASWRGRGWFEALRSPLARPVRYPPLDHDLRMRLRDFYADDVARLGQLIGRDLGSWLTSRQDA